MFSHGNEAHRGGTSSSSACARRAWRQCCLAARHRHRFNGWAGEDVWRTPSSILHPGRSWKTMENDGTPGKPMEIHKIGFQMFLCPSHPLRACAKASTHSGGGTFSFLRFHPAGKRIGCLDQLLRLHDPQTCDLTRHVSAPQLYLSDILGVKMAEPIAILQLQGHAV